MFPYSLSTRRLAMSFARSNWSWSPASHYRRRLLCRVSQTLPSAFYRALGKEAVYRVPERKHSANNWHSAKRWSTRQTITLSKGVVCRVSGRLSTRQTRTLGKGSSPLMAGRCHYSFAKCLILTLGKEAPLPSVFF